MVQFALNDSLALFPDASADATVRAPLSHRCVPADLGPAVVRLLDLCARLQVTLATRAARRC